jgi:orotate phosphoribosyltransferase
MKKYIITSLANNQKVYFNNEYTCFSGRFKTYYKNKKAANDGLQYAKKCANTQEILDNLQIEEY